MIVKGLLLQNGRQFGTPLGLVILCAVLCIITHDFLTISNLLNLAQHISIKIIIAVGMAFVIITASIQSSVGCTLAFSGVVLTNALRAGGHNDKSQIDHHAYHAIGLGHSF